RVEQLFGQGRYDEARRVHLATPPAEPRAALDEWLLNRRQELRGEVDNVEVWLGEHRADLQDMTAKLDTAIAQARITLAFDPEDSDELEATFRRAEDANRALQESARQAKERLSQRREAERALREQLLGQIDTRLKELLDSDDDRVFAAAQKHQRALRGLRPSASASTLQKFLGSLEYVLAGEPVEDAPLALPPSPSTELPSPLPSSATPDPCPPYDPLQLAEPLREQVGKPDGRADHEPWGWRKNDDFDSLPYSSRLFAAARDRLLRADGPPGMGGAPLFFHAWWSERARADSSAHSSLRRDSAAWGLLLSMIVPFEEEQAREILEPKNLAQLCGLPVGDLP
ncbi:MAG TPA: hypothetical protein PKW90_29365, partial [Myxococcota bacterium]|nr:hypothetical protein [Myxococcota bacterium]